MPAFQDYELAWKGQTYVIPSGQLLPIIAAVEEYITLPELLAKRRMPVARISQAYTVILRAVGVMAGDGKAPISEQEVYLGMFDGGVVSTKVNMAIIGLLSLMLPPETLQGEPTTPGKRKPAPSSSKASTRRSLARAG